MQHASQSNSQQVITTAQFPGIMVVVFRATPGLGNIRITRNNDLDLYNGPVVADSPPLVAFFAQGDELRHSGAACDIYGVRIGDEI